LVWHEPFVCSNLGGLATHLSPAKLFRISRNKLLEYDPYIGPVR